MDPFRVNTLDDYIGQHALKERLLIHVNSALSRCDKLDNILLDAPPGSGKTTLARVIAGLMGRNFNVFMWPVKPKTLEMIVGELDGVVLLDEIHRGTEKQQELLLNVIEDGYLQKDDGEIIESYDLTFIGATTEPQDIIPPLIERFIIAPKFEDYTEDEMAKIVRGMAERVGLDLSRETCYSLAKATAGSPRAAKAIVTMTRDMAHARGRIPEVPEVLQKLNMTPNGLTYRHIDLLTMLKKANAPVGLNVLATHLRLHPTMIMEIERLLIKRQLMEYTSVGRTITKKGRDEIALQIRT